MSDTAYCYPPDYHVLKNKLGLRDAETLDYHERELVAQRLAEGALEGDFDLAHLRSIHRHLFQDVYDWAGELRTVEISKGGNQFQFRRFIETGMAHIYRRLVASDYLMDLTRREFTDQASEIIGDVNYVHPFREGNGRVQALYLAQLAQQAGHPLDLRQINRELWMAASQAAHDQNYEPMGDCIKNAIEASLKMRQRNKLRR